MASDKRETPDPAKVPPVARVVDTPVEPKPVRPAKVRRGEEGPGGSPAHPGDSPRSGRRITPQVSRSQRSR